MANEITEITRRDIWDEIKLRDINPYGLVGELDFLGRMFNLANLPSTDHRFGDAYKDIYQHRVLNPQDWDYSWILSDPRIDLLRCSDSKFLEFLCETIHPVARSDPKEVAELLQIYNKYLAADGYQVVEKVRISGKPIFAGIKRIGMDMVIKRKNEEILKRLSADYVLQQITIMETAIEKSPHVAIGTAKELIEICCKSIFNEQGKPYDDEWNLSRLVKETTGMLHLVSDGISGKTRAASSLKQVLGSLSSIVQGISELRNEYGSGHGKSNKFKGLDPRHARLAVGAASTLAIFLLETHEAKQD